MHHHFPHLDKEFYGPYHNDITEDAVPLVAFTTLSSLNS